MPHEPKKRHSRARQGKRRAGIKLANPSFLACSNCKSMVYPHRICEKCGYYNGKQVIIKKTREQKEKAS